MKTEIDRLKITLTSNGYPPHIIKRGIREGGIITKRILQQPQQKTVKTVFFVLPYYGQETFIFSQRIKKICRKLLPHLTLNFAFRKHSTIKSVFLSLQKGQDPEKRMKKLVYKINCKNCDKHYFSETGRTRSKRMTDHKRAIRNNDESSKLAKHVYANNHTVDIDKVETMSLETSWRRRIIKESLYTHNSAEKAFNDTKHQLRVFG
ncbi:unnamed protein product [Didymodactylos carnosus]|uniref:Uncharacterized protein n=1 Tax=Didymodactylos carnosus TaxID=1234261 RepID=A0A816B2K3_9BILA|nr:unnamed protein product [Didymodactylos carnosus]CAF4413457.1 unnamed protein product [Didymodactylos carnosus]CAF4483771.1 unnamed protein product [Didymodactylos carnosus]